jgi:hypothetical protein
MIDDSIIRVFRSRLSSGRNFKSVGIIKIINLVAMYSTFQKKLRVFSGHNIKISFKAPICLHCMFLCLLSCFFFIDIRSFLQQNTVFTLQSVVFSAFLRLQKRSILFYSTLLQNRLLNHNYNLKLLT